MQVAIPGARSLWTIGSWAVSDPRPLALRPRLTTSWPFSTPAPSAGAPQGLSPIRPCGVFVVVSAFSLITSDGKRSRPPCRSRDAPDRRPDWGQPGTGADCPSTTGHPGRSPHSRARHSGRRLRRYAPTHTMIRVLLTPLFEKLSEGFDLSAAPGRGALVDPLSGRPH